MKIRDRYFLISALLLAFFLLFSLSPVMAAGVCEEGYPLPEPYTDQVREEGGINRIEGAERVIDDRGFRLLPSTLYYTHVMRRGTVGLFGEGQRVGYIVNGKNEILILWLCK